MARLPNVVGCAVQSVGRMRRFARSKAMDDTDADETVVYSLPTAPLKNQLYMAPLQTSHPIRVKMLKLTADKPLNPPTIHSLSPTLKPGRIILGSGPGHPALLTLLTHQILTTHANLVLADKLVPQGVLDLLLSKAELVIAKKFPGNADKSQEGMMHLAVQSARKGLCIVRVCRFPLCLCLVTGLLPL